MIDLDFNDDIDLVRANIGDPDSDYVSDATIVSALLKTNNDVNKSSLLVMEVMLSWFSTLAEKEIVDSLEIDYRGLYNRYKSLLDDFKSKISSKVRIPIIIGGVSLEEKNRVNEDLDSIRPFDLPDWEKLVNRTRLINEDYQ